MPLPLDQEEWRFLDGQRSLFSQWVENSVTHPAQNIVGVVDSAPPIKRILDGIQQLTQCRDNRGGRHGFIQVHDHLLPLVKLILITQRRQLAALTDEMLEKTHSPEIRAQLHDRLRPYDKWLAREGIEKVDPERMPRLTDVLTLEQAENRLPIEPLAPRVLDEKFHTLLSPSLFLDDLEYYRQTCGLRGKSVAVAFVDIDDFKEFNSKYGGETFIDVNLLPVFMAAIEAHVYGRGHAYRAGGEEYLILLPNVEESDAVGILNELRKRIKALVYQGIQEHTTVSIGLCVSSSDSILTNREMRVKANEAEQFAKEKRKDCVVSYKPGLYRLNDRYVAARDDAE